MIRLTTVEQFKALKDGTVIIQKYHKKSNDGSKFDINVKINDYLTLREQIGGIRKITMYNRSTVVNSASFRRKRVFLYIADAWMQRLY